MGKNVRRQYKNPVLSELEEREKIKESVLRGIIFMYYYCLYIHVHVKQTDCRHNKLTVIVYNIWFCHKLF